MSCPFAWRLRRSDLPHKDHKCELEDPNHSGRHVCQCGAQW